MYNYAMDSPLLLIDPQGYYIGADTRAQLQAIERSTPTEWRRALEGRST